MLQQSTINWVACKQWKCVSPSSGDPKSKSRVPAWPGSGEGPTLGCMWLTYVLPWQEKKGERALCGPFHKGTISFMRAPPSCPNNLPKASPPNATPRGLDFTLVGHKHSVYCSSSPSLGPWINQGRSTREMLLKFANTRQNGKNIPMSIPTRHPFGTETSRQKGVSSTELCPGTMASEEEEEARRTGDLERWGRKTIVQWAKEKAEGGGRYSTNSLPPWRSHQWTWHCSLRTSVRLDSICRWSAGLSAICGCE